MAFFQNSVLNKHLKGQDAEINQMVYELYGMTEDEIEIVE